MVQNVPGAAHVLRPKERTCEAALPVSASPALQPLGMPGAAADVEVLVVEMEGVAVRVGVLDFDAVGVADKDRVLEKETVGVFDLVPALAVFVQVGEAEGVLLLVVDAAVDTVFVLVVDTVVVLVVDTVGEAETGVREGVGDTEARVGVGEAEARVGVRVGERLGVAVMEGVRVEVVEIVLEADGMAMSKEFLGKVIDVAPRERSPQISWFDLNG